MDGDHKEKLLKDCMDHHYEEILNYMYLRVGNRYDAEDLTQEAFLKMTRSIEMFREESTLRTWAFTISRRTLADAYKQKSKTRRLIDRLKQQLLLRHKHDTSHIEIFELLTVLTAEDRDLVILKHYLGFSYDEISDITGLTSNHVGVKLSRAIQQVKELSEREVKSGESI